METTKKLRELPTAEPPESTQGPGAWTRVGLTVLLHPDLGRVGDVAALFELGATGHARLSRLEPSFETTTHESTGSLGTAFMSRTPIAIASVGGGEVRVSRKPDSTVVKANGVEIDAHAAFDRVALDEGVVLELASTIVLLLHLQEPRLHDTPGFGLVGESRAIQGVRAQIAQLRDVDVPVLIRGESGVGKELVAKAIHDSSRRSQQPYLPVVLSVLPENLAASMLFGHVKGAFTDAKTEHEGYFVQAHQGTLFIDEIGDTPPSVQPMLLRATQGEVQVLGAKSVRSVDVRLIAATDLDLEAAVERGDFRVQLLERLSGYEIQVPPLRRRREDIGRLLVHFLRQEFERFGREDMLRRPRDGRRSWLRPSLVARLARHAWPGNVRQLQNVALQLAVDNRDPEHLRLGAKMMRLLDEVDSLPKAIDQVSGESPPSPEVDHRTRLESISCEEIVKSLAEHRFHVANTARALRASKTWLFTRMDACPQIRKASDLGEAEIVAALSRAAGDLQACSAALQVSSRGLRLRMTKLGIEP